MRTLTAFVIGLIFGLGIVVSGMINPAKVLNFFDIAGTSDPSLAFVMGGALLVTALGYRLVFARKAPALNSEFHLPTNNAIDARLMGGSALFGIGWGLAGFCPGAALPAAGTGRTEVFVFLAALVLGIIATRLIPNLGSSAHTDPKQPQMT